MQCGFRKQRSTTDHLVRLESFVREAFAQRQHAVRVFFDLEKAYESTWKFGIMRDLHNAGLCGRLPLFIESFLKNRQFHVWLGSSYSDLRLSFSYWNITDSIARQKTKCTKLTAVSDSWNRGYFSRTSVMDGFLEMIHIRRSSRVLSVSSSSFVRLLTFDRLSRRLLNKSLWSLLQECFNVWSLI